MPCRVAWRGSLSTVGRRDVKGRARLTGLVDGNDFARDNLVNGAVGVADQ